MPDQKISADPELATPSTQARLAGIDIGTDPTKNYRFTPTGTKSWLGVANDIAAASVSAVPQFEVTAGQTLPLTKNTHQGATIVLSGAGATISFSATTQGNGFVFTLYNETGSDWTVPAFAGAINRYSKGAAHTKVEDGGCASFEVVTWSSSMRVRINGDTA